MFTFEYRKVKKELYKNHFEICVTKTVGNKAIRMVFTIEGMNEKYIKIVLPEIKENIKSATLDWQLQTAGGFKSKLMLTVFSHIKAVIGPHGKVNFDRFE